MTLIISFVLGLFFGVTLFYLRFVSEQTYCIGDEVHSDLGLQVLAELPLDPPPPSGHLDRWGIRILNVARSARLVLRRGP